MVFKKNMYMFMRMTTTQKAGSVCQHGHSCVQKGNAEAAVSAFEIWQAISEGDGTGSCFSI